MPDLQPLTVICPHAGAPHPDTQAVLDRWPVDVDYTDVSDDDHAYADLLTRLWGTGEDFLVVEHDVVPHPWAYAELALCPEPYCVFPYQCGDVVGPALGCTRFTGLFTRCLPDAAEIAARIPSNYGRPGHWRQLDVWLQAAVLRDLYGWQPHVHLPPATHRNPEWESVAAAEFRTRVDGRCFLQPGLVERIAEQVRQTPA